ncbi:MAG TPA: 50S ribosomal protein L32e, partial [Candidatus Altiarchaeales archaeon]|nr:50S ribosomal protein L32e [Candidatus Altiarchaeales archaeon]
TWRRPRGIDSKQLEEKRGKGKVPKIGYKNPDTGIIAGLRPTMVTSVADIRAMDAKTEGAMIAKQVGRKKRNMIIQEANKLNIAILNPRKGER